MPIYLLKSRDDISCQISLKILQYPIRPVLSFSKLLNYMYKKCCPNVIIVFPDYKKI